jgi:phenylpyruvate tautomerase PptA (4-oxalocrotonate tautomerase family)
MGIAATREKQCHDADKRSPTDHRSSLRPPITLWSSARTGAAVGPRIWFVPIYKCLVNGAIDEPTRASVTTGIAELEKRYFADRADDLRVSFIEVESGHWYTAGQVSSASMVLGTVPPGTPQEVRAEVMDAIATTFCAATGADFHDVMIVAADERVRES